MGGEAPFAFWNAVKPSLAAPGETFCAFAFLLCAESQWFAIHDKPRSSHATSPVSHGPENK
jgi:hypothetical protein